MKICCPVGRFYRLDSADVIAVQRLSHSGADVIAVYGILTWARADVIAVHEAFKQESADVIAVYENFKQGNADVIVKLC